MIYAPYHFFRRILLTILRGFFSFETYGSERVPHRGGAVLVGNHASFMDPPAMGVVFNRPVRFVARGTLTESKAFVWIFKLCAVIPIRRNEPDTISIRKMLDSLHAGELVGLFPEGTRTLDGKLGEFAPGAILVARRAKVPIIPVAIYGTFDALPKGRLWPRRATVRVAYGIPIDANAGSRDEVNAKVRQQIELSLEELRLKKSL